MVQLYQRILPDGLVLTLEHPTFPRAAYSPPLCVGDKRVPKTCVNSYVWYFLVKCNQLEDDLI